MAPHPPTATGSDTRAQEQQRGSPSVRGAEAILADTQRILRKLESQAAMQLADEAGADRPTTPVDAATSNRQPPAGVAAARRRDVASSARGADSCVDAVPLLAPLLCTLLRGARLQRNKCRAIALLCDTAKHCEDSVRLGRILPYLVAAAADPLAAVRAAALRGITHVLDQVCPLLVSALWKSAQSRLQTNKHSACVGSLCGQDHWTLASVRLAVQVEMLNPSDAGVVTDYVLPALSLLPLEAELSVQVHKWAACA